MATLNEIPLSFLKEHSYILYVSGRSDYRFNYGKETLFPKDFNGSVGDFLDSDLKKEYSDLYGRILKEKLDQAKRELIIKNITFFFTRSFVTINTIKFIKCIYPNICIIR